MKSFVETLERRHMLMISHFSKSINILSKGGNVFSIYTKPTNLLVAECISADMELHCPKRAGNVQHVPFAEPESSLPLKVISKAG